MTWIKFPAVAELSPGAAAWWCSGAYEPTFRGYGAKSELITRSGPGPVRVAAYADTFGAIATTRLGGYPGLGDSGSSPRPVAAVAPRPDMILSSHTCPHRARPAH